MALTIYHHGITATETSNITPIIKSVSMSTIALVSVSDDADDIAYPLDTPVLLTGITTTDVEKSGSDDQLLHQCLRTIKAIQNTSVVVLRLSEPVDVDTVDLLLSCQTSLGVTPKILIAPEIDTPAMTRKLVEIAKKRRAFVYASPRAEDGTLITVKEDIVAYRDTFAARELMLIEGGFGALGKSQPSDGSGGGFDPIVCTPTSADFAPDYQPSFSGITTVHARYRVNNGGWIDYEAEVGVDTPSQVIERFVNSIKDTSGQKLIATSFDTELTSTPFYCPGGSSAIYSGADPESPLVSFAQMSFDRSLATKIDFSVTAERPNDLVAAMFNSDQTVISCGLAFWAYQ